MFCSSGQMSLVSKFFLSMFFSQYFRNDSQGYTGRTYRRKLTSCLLFTLQKVQVNHCVHFEALSFLSSSILLLLEFSFTKRNLYLSHFLFFVLPSLSRWILSSPTNYTTSSYPIVLRCYLYSCIRALLYMYFRSTLHRYEFRAELCSRPLFC